MSEVETELNIEGKTLNSKLSRNGETRILGRYVDGYCSQDRTVYQFHGCVYHGCKKCFDSSKFNKILGESYHNLRQRTKQFTKLLENNGYTVVEKWECDYINESGISKKEIAQKRDHDFFHVTPLNPRDALYGGRTSPACLSYKVKGDEKIKYKDFTSLYSYAQKKYEFPVMHPIIYVGEECKKINIQNVFGLVKCKILPPKNLLFPILPTRIFGKLIFTLCYGCAHHKRENCEHDSDQRAICGTWTSVEVQKALCFGYKIIALHEIYHYEKRDKIFIQYVNSFMKIKQESSGVPKRCLNKNGEVDGIELKKYVEEYEKHEGIQLDIESIAHNPGKRTVMKALLNSLWGKLAQNENNTTVCFVDDYYELLCLANDNTIQLTSLDFINENLARVTYVKTESSSPTLKNRNVVVASFVTAYARLELFDVINKLGENVLYFDTDSIIYINDIDNEVETGEFLGDLTDELNVDKRDSEKWIEQFCSTGPKSYAYITNVYTRTHNDGKTELKQDEIIHAKGFSLKADKNKSITFESISSCIENNEKTIKVTYKEKIKRDNMQNIFVQDETKTFKFTFDKRVVHDDFFTTPFGYET